MRKSKSQTSFIHSKLLTTQKISVERQLLTLNDYMYRSTDATRLIAGGERFLAFEKFKNCGHRPGSREVTGGWIVFEDMENEPKRGQSEHINQNTDKGININRQGLCLLQIAIHEITRFFFSRFHESLRIEPLIDLLNGGSTRRSAGSITSGHSAAGHTTWHTVGHPTAST